MQAELGWPDWARDYQEGRLGRQWCDVHAVSRAEHCPAIPAGAPSPSTPGRGGCTHQP